MQFHPWAALAAASDAPGQPQTLWLAVGSQTVTLSDGGALALGRWLDVILEIDWSTGAVTMWRRDEGRTLFTQVVAVTPSSPVPSGVYMKQGLYRGGNVNGRSDVYWVGPTARGDTFAAVESAGLRRTSAPDVPTLP